MRSRLVVLVVTVVAAASVIFAISRFASSSPPGAKPASLPPNQASYLGVYETGPPDTYQPVADFARVAETQPNLVGYYSGWGEPFKTPFAETVRVTARQRSSSGIPPLSRSRRSPQVITTDICARSPTACGNSATRSSSASGMR